MSARVIKLLAVVLLATAALAQDPPNGPATFCLQPYALCIKAPCRPIVTRNSDGTYSITAADCLCDVLPGWSMGPGNCGSRMAQTIGGRTYMVSTYSNFFNKTNLTLSCTNPNTMWAWCYGSPCVVDEKDPSKATCTCPIQIGAMMTLGGGCKPEACNSLWSAAFPKQDAFANNEFFNYLTEHQLKPPPNPQAKNCPVLPAQ